MKTYYHVILFIEIISQAAISLTFYKGVKIAFKI